MTPYQFHRLVALVTRVEHILYGKKGISPAASKADIQAMAATAGMQGPT